VESGGERDLLVSPLAEWVSAAAGGPSWAVGEAVMVVLLLVFTPGRGDGRVSDPKADGPFPLPPGFELGTAIAAQQVEHQQPSDWTVFERDAAANNRAE